MRDHGGNLDWAMNRWGGEAAAWLDLSTGINPEPYPLPELDPRAWRALPTQADLLALCEAARGAYGASAEIVAVQGAQAAIQALPHVLEGRTARVLGPTYNEHAASFSAAGWVAETVADVEELKGADVAVVVNPNNPDGRILLPDELSALAHQVGVLIVDESFADVSPGISTVGSAGGNLVVLRSFGKFFGLAGVRLGFAIGSGGIIQKVRDISGPWPVSGPAIEIGRRALLDRDWQSATRKQLAEDAVRLDALAVRVKWRVLGGTDLFRLYEVRDAVAAQEALAASLVWSRIFPYSKTWVRLGLPGGEGWDQLEQALV